MKARIQTMLGLLFIAITISMIAVSFAWYSAESADIQFSGTSVSITTSDDVYIDQDLTPIGNLVQQDNKYILSSPSTPYHGQEGKANTTGADNVYILLFEVAGGVHCSTDITSITSCTLSRSDVSPIDGDVNQFQVLLLSLNDDGTYSVASGLGTYTYFAIVFSNGTETPFTYSDSSYMGYGFSLSVYFKNETE